MKSKRRCITIIMMLLAIIGVKAQDLVAYHVIGKVTYSTSSGNKNVELNTRLSASTMVNIPYGGKLELLDEQGKKRIIISQVGKGTIKQLSSDNGNSVSALTEKYVAYVKKQLTNKGLTSNKRYTDFAVVTRKQDSINTSTPQKNGSPFADRFNNFKKQTQTKFKSFREECNDRYISFVRETWEKCGKEPPILRPTEPRFSPVVLDTLKRKKPIEKKEKEAVQIAKGDEEAPKIEQPKPIEEIKEVDIPIAEKEFAEMPFIFFGNELTVRLDETKRVNLGKINPDKVAKALKHFSGQEYDNLLFDCLKLRKEHKLCDWAYLEMLKNITEQFCGSNTNEAVLLMGYLYYQSGYKMRFAHDDNNNLAVLVATDYIMYGRPYFTIDNTRFYPIQDVPLTMNICKATFPKEQQMSLHINESMLLEATESDTRTITSADYPDFKFTATINRNLIDFYDTYPTASFGGSELNRWLLHANAPLDSNLKANIYPQLKAQLENLSEYEAVSRLLNVVQTGLTYGYDTELWGGDRTFFAEESLYYPYCDCEDRSILFTRLVRDLLGLDCVLIYYPGHIASAVHFNEEVAGNYYKYEGKNYVVCDATYIHASVGMEMEDEAAQGATLIPLK